MDIKLAGKGKGKEKKPERPLVEGHQDTVDKCIAKHREIESMAAEVKLLEDEITKEVSNVKEASSEFVKTLDVAGSHEKMQIQFKDNYSKIDPDMKGPLQQLFGPEYDILFTEDTSVEVKVEMMKELKELLGDKFYKFFGETKTLKPSKEFQKTFHTLKGKLTQEQRETADKILGACQSKPSVIYPK